MNERPCPTAGRVRRTGLRGSLLIALATLTAAAAAQVDGAVEAAEQRARIAAQRVQADAAWQARRAECADRFVVTSCMEAAEARHRQQIDALDRELDALETAQRRQRAAERLEIIRRKTEAVAAASETGGGAARALEPLPSIDGPATAAQESPPSSAEREVERRRAEAAREAAARATAARQRRIEAERRRVEREQRRVGGARAGAAPLPVPPSMPSAASAPAR